MNFNSILDWIRSWCSSDSRRPVPEVGVYVRKTGIHGFDKNCQNIIKLERRERYD